MGKKKGGGENIRVVIRLRNLIENELQRGDTQAVRIDLATQQIVVSHPIGDPDVFAFDAVYNNSFTQKDLFIQEVQPLIESVLQGYNATVFAYGQSGSGKTYTMTGDIKESSMWGMMPQAVDFIFNSIKQQQSSTKCFKVRITYVELYNGRSRDLLSDKHINLEIKENLAKAFYVKGAEQPEVTSFKECMKYFNQGTARRQTASTDLNDQSSRSHSLFTIMIEQSDFEQDPTNPTIMTSKINIVDLAGSEKLSKSNATGETAHEGCNINLSLSALATVIDSIIKNARHVPFRGNPLTMLLKDSLGGTAKTAMFANVGPSDKNIAETISTLRFATRAKQIENKPIKNIDPKDARIQELLEKLEDLQRRLSGEYNPQEEEDLQRRIEELEVENSELRSRQEKDNIEINEEFCSVKANFENAQRTITERERAIEQQKADYALLEANMKNETAYSQEIKSVISGFIKRVLTVEQLQEIQRRMPKGYSRADDGWELREIQCYLEGFLEVFEAFRTSSYTEEDMKKYAARVGGDAEEALRREFAEAVHQREELERQAVEAAATRRADAEIQAQLKVELQKLREEGAQLRERGERDAEKAAARVQRAKEELKATEEQLAAANDRCAAAHRDVEKLKRMAADAGVHITSGGVGHSSSLSSGQTAIASSMDAGEVAELRAQRDHLQQKLREVSLALRRQGVSLHELAPEGDKGGDESEAERFTLTKIETEEPPDGDLIALLQQQVRLQHRLERLRHGHQERLNSLVRRYEYAKTGRVNAEGCNGAEAGSAEKVKRATQESERVRAELEAVRSENEKAIEKLVRKLNKRQSDLKELETTLAEERIASQEEKKKLSSALEEAQRASQAFALEAERAHIDMREAQTAADNATKAKDSQGLYWKKETGELVGQIEALKARLAKQDALVAEHKRLQQENSRLEADARVRLEQLEANRQTIKSCNGVLETERKRSRELEAALKAMEIEFAQRERMLRQELAENANKLAIINNKRLQDQAEDYMQVIQEEKEKQNELRDRLRVVKSRATKAAQRYDEMVLENDMLQRQLEELKVSAMKIFRENRRLNSI